MVTAVGRNGFWFQDPTPDADPRDQRRPVRLHLLRAGRRGRRRGHGHGHDRRVPPRRRREQPDLDRADRADRHRDRLRSAGARARPWSARAGACRRRAWSRTTRPATSRPPACSSTRTRTGWTSGSRWRACGWRSTTRASVGPRSSFGELPVVPAGATVRTDRGGILLRATDPNPERVILDDVLAPVPVGERRRPPRRRHGRRARLLLRQLQAARHRQPDRRVRWPTPRGDPAVDERRARRRHLQRGEPRPERPAVEVRRARQPGRHEPRQPRTSWRWRRCRTTTDRRTTAVVAADQTLDQLRRRDRRGRRPGVPVASDRPGRRRRRRRAGRQHPGRVPLPHRPRAVLRRPSGRDGRPPRPRSWRCRTASRG